jgi:hypothetical protein
MTSRARGPARSRRRADRPTTCSARRRSTPRPTGPHPAPTPITADLIALLRVIQNGPCIIKLDRQLRRAASVLSEEGLVAVEPSPSDGEDCYVLTLTEEGRALLEAMSFTEFRPR